MTAATGPLVRWGEDAPDQDALVCLPWAGAGASPYRAWAPVFAGLLALYGVRFGGRESRIGEPPPASVAAAVGEVVTAVGQLPHPGIHVLGHCSGAIIAFEVARALRGANGRVRGLTVVGQVAPSRLADSPLEGDPTRFIPAEFRGEPDLVELLAPVIAADTRAVAGYEYEPGPPLGVAITAIRSALDDELSDAELRHWAAETTARCDVQLLAGADHLFSGASWPALAEAALWAATR